MGNWLRDIAETVSDWIPNEFSKTSNNWTGNIPYVGWVMRGLAGADNAAETYANSGNFMDAAQHGWTGFSGNAADPNLYSEKNQAGMFRSGDPWLSIGQGAGLLQNGSGQPQMQGVAPGMAQPLISQQDQYANIINELLMRKRQELELQRRMGFNPNFDSLPASARITMGNPYNGQYSPTSL